MVSQLVPGRIPDILHYQLISRIQAAIKTAALAPESVCLIFLLFVEGRPSQSSAMLTSGRATRVHLHSCCLKSFKILQISRSGVAEGFPSSQCSWFRISKHQSRSRSTMRDFSNKEPFWQKLSSLRNIPSEEFNRFNYQVRVGRVIGPSKRTRVVVLFQLSCKE